MQRFPVSISRMEQILIQLFKTLHLLATQPEMIWISETVLVTEQLLVTRLQMKLLLQLISATRQAHLVKNSKMQPTQILRWNGVLLMSSVRVL